MKRKEKKQLKIFFISIIFLLSIIFIFGLQQTTLKGANRMSCQTSSSNTWSCFMIGHGGVGSVNNEFILSISKPSKADIYSNLLCQTMKSVTNVNCPVQGAREPSATWRGKVSNLFKQNLVNQIIIINAKLPSGEEIKLKGTCYAEGRKCILRDVINSDIILNTINTTIYFKQNGFDNNSCVLKNSEICVGYNLTKCINYKKINEGLIDGKCGYVKPDIEQNKITENVTLIDNKTINQENNIFSNFINLFTNDKILNNKSINSYDNKFNNYLIYISIGIIIILIILNIIIIYKNVKKK